MERPIANHSAVVSVASGNMLAKRGLAQNKEKWCGLFTVPWCLA